MPLWSKRSLDITDPDHKPSVYTIGKDAVDNNGTWESSNLGYEPPVSDSLSDQPSVHAIGKDAIGEGKYEFINLGFDSPDLNNRSNHQQPVSKRRRQSSDSENTTRCSYKPNYSTDINQVLSDSAIKMSQQQKELLNKSHYNDIENDRDKIPHSVVVERETWGKKIEFLLAIIGFAIDLGNVWRFPFICFKNGGGAFLIPYFIMLIFIGIPLFYMELALGQYHRSGPISIWLHICPIFCGIGYGICFIATFIGSYYNTVIAWAVYYLIASFTAEVPWKSCNNSWNTPNCVSLQSTDNITNTSSSPAEEYFLREVLAMQESSGIDDLGNVKWDLCLCLLAVFVIIYFCLWKGVKSSGKAVWVTAIAPFVILLALLIRGVTLPGAELGLLYYIRPDFSRLLTVQVWLDAAAQVFFSLGPGFGTLIALSSYNKFDNNCYFDAIITSIINCFTSLLAGVAVFSVIGYMALKQGKKIEDVAVKGPGLVFIVYPEALATIPWASFWSVLFFLMLLTLGLDSSFGGLESVITALSDAYPRLNKRRELLVLAVIIYCFILGLPSTTYGGQYFMQIMDTHGAAISLLFICFCEIVALNWFYGVKRFSDDIQAMLGHRPGIFWQISWCFISPISLLLIFVLSIVGYGGISLDDYIFPLWCQYVGWAITFISIICVPIYMVYRVCITPGSFKTKLIKSIEPIVTTHLSNGTDIKMDKVSNTLYKL